MDEARIKNLSHDGRGIALINNKKTFVNGVLPNELVRYQITKKRSSYNEATLIEILETSPARITPSCAHFGVCGGCSLQHMAMETQLALKQETLLNQLTHFAKVVPEKVIPPLSANHFGYRRKARLGVKYVLKKNKLLVGFREKASRYLADIQSCAVLHPSVGNKLTELAQLIASLTAFQHIPQIEVAIGDDEVALIFRHLTDLEEEDVTKLAAFGKAHCFQIYLQPNQPATINKIWPQDDAAFLQYSLPQQGLTFLFHPLDFTQINLELNRLMVQQVLAFLDLKEHDSALDLFCGLGNFTLPIAKYVKHVVGVEGSHEMVLRASENARYNNLENTTFCTANLTADLKNAPWLHRQYNKVLLDPPRVGAQAILPHLKQFAAEKIVYVSCNPATLARDAGEIVHQHGYRLTHIGMMNMFPQTSHIEAMAVFEK